MGSKINSSTIPILHRSASSTKRHISEYYSSFPHAVKSSIHLTAFSTSNSNQSRQEPALSTTTVITKAPPPATGQPTVKLQALRGCTLGISRYPDFEYNAQGGTGTGRICKKSDGVDGGVLSVSFDAGTLYIPPLTGATTGFLGLPLPPFLKIDIVPEALEGTINKDSGKVDLQFRAKFLFSVGSIYRAPPLMVETMLTSEESKGAIRSGKGERMDGEGNCLLVGVATVDTIDDMLMDSFLGLPTECIAGLNARISFFGSS